ncbi:MAG: hypothetical protein ABW194_04065 [Novosphingobium sp.]
MLDFLGDLLAGSVSTSETPRGPRRWLGCLLLFVVFGVGGGALALYAWLESLEVSR